MSWQKFVTLFCDGEGCDAAYASGEIRVSEARDVAPDWTYVDGDDLCPTCSWRREGGDA
jgi:hypothetical protein